MTDDRYLELELKEIDRQRKKHRKKHYLLRFLIFVCAVVGLVLFLRSDYFAIKEISVEGNTYYTDNEVLAIARGETGRNILFDSGRDEIKENLLKDPYFKSVKVKKNYPDRLTITVEERRQVAAMGFGDSFVIIDEEGIVLRKSDVEPKLTILTGLTISKMDVGERLETEESESLETTLKMLATMEEGDIYFKKIDVSKVIIKAYIYDNLTVKGTPLEVNSAIESGELQKVVSDLFSKGVSRGTITMGGSSYMSFSPETEND